MSDAITITAPWRLRSTLLVAGGWWLLLRGSNAAAKPAALKCPSPPKTTEKSGSMTAGGQDINVGSQHVSKCLLSHTTAIMGAREGIARLHNVHSDAQRIQGTSKVARSQIYVSQSCRHMHAMHPTPETSLHAAANPCSCHKQRHRRRHTTTHLHFQGRR
jgi:hypothetical protein